MKKTISLIFITLFCNTIFSQAAFLQWAKQIGGPNSDANGLESILNDSLGNKYISGTFSGTVDFDLGVGTYSMSSINPTFYVTKTDSNDNFVWAKTLNLNGVTTLSTIDKQGNLYFSGTFTSTTDFNPGTGTYTLATNYYQRADGFILKLDENFNFVWAKPFINLNNSAYSNFNPPKIKVDNGGNVFAAGVFEGSYDFNPGTATNSISSTTVSSTYYQNSYLVKLNSVGNYVWSTGFFYNLHHVYITSINLDVSGNPVVGGYYQTYSTSANADCFLIKYSNAGTYLWQKYIQTTSGPDRSMASTIDLSGNIISVGYYLNTINFNTDGGTYNQTSVGYDIFITKFSPTGSWLWTKTYIGNNHDYVNAVKSDKLGNIYLTGPFLSASCDFDPGTPTYNLSAQSGQDVYVSKLDPSGNFKWAKAFGGSGSDIGRDLIIDKNENVFVIGSFVSTVDFDPDAGTTNLTSNGAEDLFSIKLTNCIYDAPNICLVTVDSLALNNVIYWDKSVYPQADTFIVHRYDAFTTTYKIIGTKSINQPNFLIDTSRTTGGPNGGDPQYSSYRYKISIKGNCGGTGTKGLYHESIFIQQNNQNFSWNAYGIEGQSSPATGYQFMRDNNNTGNWQVLVNTGGLSTTDPNYASYPNGNWRVDAMGFSCNPTAKTTQVINKSKSNVKNNFVLIPTSVNELVGSANVSIVPNPATTELMVSFHEPLKSKTTITVTNVIGAIVYETELHEGNNIMIPVNEYTKGIYFVKIKQGINVNVRKFIKE